MNSLGLPHLVDDMAELNRRPGLLSQRLQGHHSANQGFVSPGSAPETMTGEARLRGGEDGEPNPGIYSWWRKRVVICRPRDSLYGINSSTVADLHTLLYNYSLGVNLDIAQPEPLLLRHRPLLAQHPGPRLIPGNEPGLEGLG